MNLLVTGTQFGRPDVEYWLNRWLLEFGRPALLVLGDARGVDTQAWRWAKTNSLKYVRLTAYWKKLGKRAGMERNSRMVELCDPGDWCLALPHPLSRGTWDCYAKAKKKGLHCLVCPEFFGPWRAAA